jgi:uncharacterized protein YuzB (UPF0349 family)
MKKQIYCCVNNLAQFQYGSILQELVDQGHSVELERCQSQCVGCSQHPAATVDGQWRDFDNAREMLEYVGNK